MGPSAVVCIAALLL
ncbi:hypothetical protein LOCC1_G008861 [Lachnellula occidentalis]|uniref:Uncharacterized protein n=1 Tax=Lachnellula occidentalis TaxID=215460 RepID=A0A8H8RCX2_9HELO|nr:hypothetical protein LOCC1_G008861 [Lachnellula occidentalis]